MRFKQVVTNKERAINANNIKSLRDESKFNDVYINEASLRGGDNSGIILVIIKFKNIGELLKLR